MEVLFLFFLQYTIKEYTYSIGIYVYINKRSIIIRFQKRDILNA